MNTYSILFANDFKYMGITMSNAVVMITAKSFADVINLVQKRMSKKNENALLFVEAVMMVRSPDGWGKTFESTIAQSKAAPESIVVTTIYDL